MALFKINRGNSASLPVEKHDGWAYFCTDTGEFYIDYADDNGNLCRKQINADEAKSLTNPIFTDYIVHGDQDDKLSNIIDTYILSIDYSALAFDTSEIIFGTNTSSVLGQAILGQLILA